MAKVGQRVAPQIGMLAAREKKSAATHHIKTMCCGSGSCYCPELVWELVVEQKHIAMSKQQDNYIIGRFNHKDLLQLQTSHQIRGQVNTAG